MPTLSARTAYEHPRELLQHLIRFDTTNPPGNEAECIRSIQRLLQAAGLQTEIAAKDPRRPNLVARLKGHGQGPPLLLHGHVDVVTTGDQVWRHPPFSGKISDGFIWGRGTVDMKGGVAMMLAALLRAKAEGSVPAGDIVLALSCDEEAGGRYGARYLVENHPQHFKGVRYALGEFGGVPLCLGRYRFYPICVAEKQACTIKVTLRGPGGHASQPVYAGTMTRLARLLLKLHPKRMPVHITPAARHMIEAAAAALPPPIAVLLRQLLVPSRAAFILRLLGHRGSLIAASLQNTVNATIVRGGHKINVVPGAVVLKFDGRLLPSFGPEMLRAELRRMIGQEPQIEIVSHQPGPSAPDMGLYATLAAIIREADPAGIPIPGLMSGSSDARFFTRLGIQTYGFTPMSPKPKFDYVSQIHAADERIPVEAVDFGTHAIYKVLQRFGSPV